MPWRSGLVASSTPTELWVVRSNPAWVFDGSFIEIECIEFLLPYQIPEFKRIIFQFRTIFVGLVPGSYHKYHK
jgi:hypothetical protein